MFFDDAAIAVYADKRGGWKAAVIPILHLRCSPSCFREPLCVALLDLASYGGLPWKYRL